MTAPRRSLWLAGAAGLALLALHAATASSGEKGTGKDGQGQAAAPPAQAAQAPQAARAALMKGIRLDVGKSAVIEPRVEALVKQGTGTMPPTEWPPNGAPYPPNGERPARKAAAARAPRVDVGKSLVIEPRVEALVKNGAAPQALPPPPKAAPRPPDVGKRLVIEPRVREVVKNGSTPAALPARGADRGKKQVEAPVKAAARGSAAEKFVNPKVAPGKVRWHKTFADACAAAKKSGKPVLLFQMMGKLDDRFC